MISQQLKSAQDGRCHVCSRNLVNECCSGGAALPATDCQMQTWGQGDVMHATCCPEPMGKLLSWGIQLLPHMAPATPGIGANPRDGKAAAASVTTQLPPCSTGTGRSLSVHCCAYRLVLAFSVQTLHHGPYWFCLLELNFIHICFAISL